MNWKKIEILNDSGEKVEAQAPIIISASRSTDIPAFYSDWFVERWKKGYVKWKNPFNQKLLYVSFDNTRLIVFWTKNPKPMIKHIDFLKSENVNFYFQFTLNDYVDELLEPNVPSVESRIETFLKLSEQVGKERVIWRFDPLILTDKIGIPELLSKIEKVGNQLYNYTNKLVFSYADIEVYRKVKTNLSKSNINYSEFCPTSMMKVAEGLQNLNKKWNLDIGTCAENIDLSQYGIKHNKCVDDDLMKNLFYNDKILMEFLGYEYKEADLFDGGNKLIPIKDRNLKDKGQRKACGCVYSKDIGQYNTCPHLCEYCYANANKKIVLSNYNSKNSNNQANETII